MSIAKIDDIEKDLNLFAPIALCEAMPFLNERSAQGRVVVNPPDQAPPLKVRETGDQLYFCNSCGTGFINNKEKYISHMKGHGKGSCPRPTHEREEFDKDGNESIPVVTPETNGSVDDVQSMDYQDKTETMKVNKDMLSFACVYCKDVFSNLKSYRFHMRSQHRTTVTLEHISDFNKKRVRSCHECGVAFLACNIYKHMESSHDPKNNYTCSYCSCRFAKYETLGKHIKQFHSLEPKEPDRKPTYKASDVFKSIESTIDDVIYEKKETLRLKTKATRKRISIDEDKWYKSFKCRQYADESVSVKKSSDRTGVVYRCKKCLKTFKYLTSLQDHFSVHTGQRFHKCNKCSMSFAAPYKLFNHQKIAHSNGILHCPFCPCSFQVSHHLSRHVKEFHKNEAAVEAGENHFIKVF